VNSEPMAGDLHLDATENWHAGDDIDIYSVALHEAGHAIGLVHSDKPGDVMYPYYRRGMALSVNDIGAARQLYGATASGGGSIAPVTSAPVPAPAPTQTPVPVPSPTPGPAPAPAPAALSVSLDAVSPPGQATQISLSGLESGGTAPVVVQWQTDRGYSGKATLAASGSWLASGVTLVTGTNTITVSALDAAHHAAVQSVTVTRLQTTPAAGAAPLAISIRSPSTSTYSTSASGISLSGKAGGGAGVTQVTWQTAAGASGMANGAEDWIAPGVPLLMGTNTIIVRAADARGASAWASVVVVRH